MAVMFRKGPGPRRPSQFDNMKATQLYCPTCRQAMPVREKLALFLLSGAIYHYVCVRCNAVLGKKEDAAPPIVG